MFYDFTGYSVKCTFESDSFSDCGLTVKSLSTPDYKWNIFFSSTPVTGAQGTYYDNTYKNDLGNSILWWYLYVHNIQLNITNICCASNEACCDIQEIRKVWLIVMEVLCLFASMFRHVSFHFENIGRFLCACFWQVDTPLLCRDSLAMVLALS